MPNLRRDSSNSALADCVESLLEVKSGGVSNGLPPGKVDAESSFQSKGSHKSAKGHPEGTLCLYKKGKGYSVVYVLDTVSCDSSP